MSLRLGLGSWWLRDNVFVIVTVINYLPAACELIRSRQCIGNGIMDVRFFLAADESLTIEIEVSTVW